MGYSQPVSVHLEIGGLAFVYSQSLLVLLELLVLLRKGMAERNEQQALTRLGRGGS